MRLIQKPTKPFRTLWKLFSGGFSTQKITDPDDDTWVVVSGNDTEQLLRPRSPSLQDDSLTSFLWSPVHFNQVNPAALITDTVVKSGKPEHESLRQRESSKPTTDGDMGSIPPQGDVVRNQSYKLACTQQEVHELQPKFLEFSISLSSVFEDMTIESSGCQVQSKRTLMHPSLTTDLGIWTKEALEAADDFLFREFLCRQRILEWRRYRVRHSFVSAPYRGEYLVIKIGDENEACFLRFQRLIQPKDAHLWMKRDEEWLECVENEGLLDDATSLRTRISILGRRRTPSQTGDIRLIWGRWTPSDRVTMLMDWPRNDTERERHVFEADVEADLLDLLIATRTLHLSTSFNMFRRQDHWFAKVLSRILNQKWDKHDKYSVSDTKKFDYKFIAKKGVWDRQPVSVRRHEEVLKLRNYCVKWREEIMESTASTSWMESSVGQLDCQTEARICRRPMLKTTDKEGAKISWDRMWKITKVGESRTSKRLRKMRK